MSPQLRMMRKNKVARKNVDASGLRLLLFKIAIVLCFCAVSMRLLVLQVLSHDFYAALATNQHSIFSELFPERGTVYLSDPKSASGIFPAAVNRDMALVYAVPKDIDDPRGTAVKIAGILELDEAEVERKLSLKNDPYEPLKRRVPDETVELLKSLDLQGIHFAPEAHRFYPEGPYLSHVIGFVGSNSGGERVGRYGIEGFWNAELAGKPGYLKTERDPVGRWIGSAERSFRPAEDGADIVLTIDRTIQYITCERLKEAVRRHGAAGGAVVILEPDTGAVLAMCGMPDFDPNGFSSIRDISTFNNPAIFDAYEPGSIFKPMTMAAAIDAGRVGPNTMYNDEGQVKIGQHTIRNSDGKANGWQSMTQVLEKSLNTGTIFAVRELGPDLFRRYVDDFGFGARFGVGLDTEASGDTSSLTRKGDIWSATASYGQGISATPLQMAVAFGAIANGGKLMKPYVVDRIVHSDGSESRTEPVVIRQVISKRAASLVGGMLVRVVENGHGKKAGVPGYWIAGKTGTAQVAKKTSIGYEENAFIGSFAGFAPVDDPRFVILVRIDRPSDVQWAESTAAPLFGEIAEFLLNYLHIPPNRAQ